MEARLRITFLLVLLQKNRAPLENCLSVTQNIWFYYYYSNHTLVIIFMYSCAEFANKFAKDKRRKRQKNGIARRKFLL